MIIGVMAAITVAMFGLVIAPYVPILGRTRVGGPRLRARFRINGDPSLALTVPQGGTRLALLEVEVENKDRADVQGANVALEAPVGLGLTPSGPDFNPVNVGERRPGSTLAERWVRRRELVPGRDVEHFYFLMRFGSSGSYDLRFTVVAPVLFRKLEQGCTISVEQVDQEPEGKEAKSIAELIEEGRRLQQLNGDAFSPLEDQLRLGVMAWLFMAANVLPEEDFNEFQQAEDVAYTGPQVGVEYLQSLIRARLRVLEAIQRRG